VALVRTDVSEELMSSIIRVKRIIGLATTLANYSQLASLGNTTNVFLSPLILFTLMIEAIGSSETSILATARRRHM
jgi:hypothetical protein